MAKLNVVLSMVGLATLLACAGGETSNAQGDIQDVTGERPTTFADFKTAMTDAKGRVESGDCFTVVTDASGITLTAKEDAKSAQLVVAPNAQIIVTKRTFGDGSFTKAWKIDGVGDVTVTSADDAFERVAVSSITPRVSANCEVDF